MTIYDQQSIDAIPKGEKIDNKMCIFQDKIISKHFH